MAWVARFLRIQITCSRKDRHTHKRVIIWNGLFEMYARIVQRLDFFGEVQQLKDKLAEVEAGPTHLFEAIP